MKKLLLVLTIFLALCGCKENNCEDEKENKENGEGVYFTYKEASAYLTEDDREIIGNSWAYINEYREVCRGGDEALIEKSHDIFEKGFEPLKTLYGAANDKTPAGIRRAAAIAWTMANCAYMSFNGTSAIWVVISANLGLIDAMQLMENPPDEDMASYLLSPEEQQRRKANHLPPYGAEK